MKKEQNNIWIGQQDLTQDSDFFAGSLEEKSLIDVISEENNAALGSNRRDFLKFLGFGLGAATIAAGCDIPVKRAIPYVVKPDSIVPGVATYYASTFVDGGDAVSILVKTREGRPVKIEGNASSPITKGGTNARVQASVLSLYDTNRLKQPMAKTKDGSWSKISWEDLDKSVMADLATAGNIVLLTSSTNSPSASAAFEQFKLKYPNSKIVAADNVSYSALLEANEINFGKRAIPTYHFDKAQVIVSFNADFLGTWVSPTSFAKDYVKGRVVSDIENVKMSRHFQVESHMSLTGSNADHRILVKPSEQGVAIAYLYNEIVGGGASSTGLNDKAKSALKKVADQLKANAGNSLVISGTNNLSEQLMVNAINNALGNYGNTINTANWNYSKAGIDSELNTLISDMKSGLIGAILINDVNVAYNHPSAAEFKEALAKVKLKVSFAASNDETTDLCDYVAIKPHFLESWGDVQLNDEVISVIQPTIAPLFNSRQYEHSLLVWGAVQMEEGSNYFDFVKSVWQNKVFSAQNEFLTVEAFLNGALHNGVVNLPSRTPIAYNAGTASLSEYTKPNNSELEISFFETVNIGNGQHATNPWLQEMPDPIARTSWANYLAVPVNFDGISKFIGFNDLKDGDLVSLTINGETFSVPVIQQFGQMPGTVAIAMGYGRELAGATGTGVGVNVAQVCGTEGGRIQYYATDVKVSNKTGTEKYFSCVQYHHTFGVTAKDSASGETINADEAATVDFDYGTGIRGFQGALTDRSIIYTTSANKLKENVEVVQKKREHAQYLNSKQIYRGFDSEYGMGHHWGMHVDLNACIGCGACTVACMSENNVPVVGKKEVSRHHEMTWLRIDRYYYGSVENPNTVYQPMMCQHCDNAPCENVCPVNATNHSSEGLNQMTYNRCVGTRYCANNCPFKVRRFNWLDYTTADLFPGNSPTLNGEEVPFGADNLTRMVLNPDVTVRSRGVIEKCSFCVQRIQEGKLTAKREGRKLIDNDVKTACQTSCPTGAITFGDMNNKGDVLDTKLSNPLNYIVLEEVNVRPSVNYTIKVNNRDESLEA